MPLHPAASRIIEIVEAQLGGPLGAYSPAETRRLQKENAPSPPPPEPCSVVFDRTIPGPAGDIPVRVYRPSAADGLPMLAWFHQGGWVLGDLDGADVNCRRLANAAGCVVVSVDYRLAPEHRYPAAAEDCYAATAWLAEHAAELGGDGTRLAVAGDSAGGNLAAVVSLMARDRGGPAIAHQVLVYPVIDFALETPSYADNAEGYLLTKSSMQWFWDHYMGPDGDPAEPYASPLRAESLAGLPPATVVTAEFDPLRDEGDAYAARLAEAGVDVVHVSYDGMIHAFLGMLGVFDEAAAAHALVAERLRDAFEG